MTKDELFLTGSSYAPVQRYEIAGIDKILKEVDIIVYWLLNFEKFAELKSRIQPGVLFAGTPGTGKTMMARYIATVSKALFVNVRDWPAKTMTAADIKEIFGRARRYYAESHRPIILFWDEFENYAQDRKTIGASSRGDVVSQLTAELDGVNGKCPGVLFIGCTNFKDAIDEALLRAGRMGIHLHFLPPDRPGKVTLLKNYLPRHPIADDIDYESASYFFEDHMTAAAVEEGVERIWLQAAMDAFKENKEAVITNSVIHSVLLDNLLGTPPPFMELKENSERRVAVHELGHALTAYHLSVPVRIITIRPGDDTFGRTYIKEAYDKIASCEDMFKQMCVFLGSVYSEREVGIDNSFADVFDTERATGIAMNLTDGIGQDYLGLMNFDAFAIRARSAGLNPLSERYKHMYDERARDLIDKGEKQVKSIMRNIGKDAILGLADELVRDKTWTGLQFGERMLQMRPNGGAAPLRFNIPSTTTERSVYVNQPRRVEGASE